MANIKKPHAAAPTRQTRMRGAAAVELAILAIPMLLLAFGVAEYGRAMYEYNTITKSVRNAARMLSEYNPDNVDYPIDTAKCLAVYGNTTCTGSPLAPDLTTDKVQIVTHKNIATGHGTINMVEVRVSGYRFDFIFDPRKFFGNEDTQIPFGNIQATMRQIL